MMLSPDDRRARACSELRRGVPIVLEDEDGSVALAASAEMLSPRIYDALCDIQLREDIASAAVAVTDRRARTLKARVYDGDIARIALDEGDPLERVKAIANPALDLDQPLMGPYLADRGGTAELHRAAIALCKRAQLLPAAVVYVMSGARSAQDLADRYDLTCLARRDAGAPLSAKWREASAARVPITVAPNCRLRVFQREGWDDEHYAIEIGQPPRDAPVLTRLHSACATGDLFGSLKCDCGPQLHAALGKIADEGGGVLLYLLQEGRGIGLANKMRAYKLQDEGFDTVDANHRLGFQDDERLLSDGGEILRVMGFRSARLLTNNPKKIAALSSAGVDVVERVPLVTETNPENVDYLRVKAAKSGHLL